MHIRRTFLPISAGSGFTDIMADRGLLQAFASGAHDAIAAIKATNTAITITDVFLFICFLLF
jgi:hypothetical protein